MPVHTLKLNDPDLVRAAGYIAGEWREVSTSKATFDVTNPSTGEKIITLPDMGAAEAAEAIEAAHKAQKIWAARTTGDRAVILRKYYDLMVEHADDLATILTAEMGKPWAEARGEVLYGASFIQWFQEEAKRVYGDVIPQTSGRQAHYRPQTTDWRCGFHHAVEFPKRHDCPQSRTGTGIRLFHRRQTCRTNTAVWDRYGRAGRARRPACRVVQPDHSCAWC